jgi:hypothetical protein
MTRQRSSLMVSLRFPDATGDGARMPARYVKDPRVDAYIAALPAWQQGICASVRDLVHQPDPAVAETIKRRVQIIANNRAGGWRRLKVDT